MNDTEKTITKNISDWLPELEDWEKENYDGIKGSPPEWTPEPYKNKFFSARSLLFHFIKRDKQEYKNIKSRFDKLATEKNSRIVMALLKDKTDYDEYLFYLVDLFKSVSLGKEKGLIKLAGRDGLLGHQRRESLSKFGDTHGKELHNKRSIEWNKWRSESNRLIKKNHYLATNKSELARRIKENLKLAESTNTIRQRI